MLGIVRQAYETRDIQLARDAAAMDNAVDEGEQDIIKQVFAWQKEHPDDFMISTHALWITHSMERIGDRVTNIAERVIYIATSKTVKLN
jgi:phosphate transport system protein